jgi:hypothetical protein
VSGSPVPDESLSIAMITAAIRCGRLAGRGSYGEETMKEDAETHHFLEITNSPLRTDS